MTALLSLLAGGPAAACTTAITLDLIWPADGAVVPPDTVVVVHRVVSAAEVTLLDPVGADVPVQTWTLPGPYADDTYEVLVPEAALAPGVYSVGLGGYGDHTFTVTAGETAPGVAPVPVWRTFATDLLYTDECGSGEEIAVDRVMYRLCGDAVLYVALAGAAAPTAAHVSEAQPWAYDHDTLDLGGVLQTPATLWFAAMDGAGRFSAWTGPDEVVMPGPQQLEQFTMPDAEGGGTTTPTSFSSCPPYGEWVSEGLEECERGTDCVPVSGSGGSAGGCGCAGGELPRAGVAGLLLLLATRRRARGG